MFLEGSLHIFLIYLLILLLVIIFPLVFKSQWNNLLNYFNKFILSKTKARNLTYLSLISGISLICGSMVIISMFNMNLFHSLPSGELSFTLFAGFAFLLLPLGIALVCTYGWARHNHSFQFGNFFLIVFCFLTIGLAGSNLHDILWCGMASDWYSTPIYAGYDLDLWINIFQPPNRDYRIFGFYMGFHVLIFCAYCFENLRRYFGALPKAAKILKIKLGLLLTSLIIELGSILFIIDYPWIFTTLETALTVFLCLPLLILPCYFAGKYVQALERHRVIS